MRNRIISIVIVLLFCTPILANNYLLKSRKAYSEARHDDAVSYALKELANDPNNSSAHWGCALAYYSLNLYAQALYHYRKTAELSSSITAKTNLGGFLGQIGYSKEAIEALDQAIAMDSLSVMAYSTKGGIQIHSGELDEAIKNLETAIRIDPTCAIAYLNIRIAYSFKDKEKSEEYMIRFRSLTPASLQALKEDNPYKTDSKKRADLQVAIDYCTQELKINRYSKIVLQRAGLYKEAGKKELAKKDYLQALTIYNEIINDLPDSWSMYLIRARIYSDLGEFEKSAADFRKVLSLNPHQLSVPNELEKVEQQMEANK